ncbi:DUF262 domain-containing protein [Lysinibacillus irui]|uniref:DUF262 domain-containing protein n=1 Tax=Lysinibacillus irui TaxID=2998077 RepID=A0ABU5NIZ0_9BACI|nr:DUF262 domain-containing protein [Lysinibacillus irui]MEA0553581.1 DUF262 domain-containing protein [Lysinibacillus irui]MEA0975965.1 DUF262 domain-containing protein [Lysinibacillus irui]MEA1042119.1 DUF262 domain-containing protein [Lysinibacillus irui]
MQLSAYTRSIKDILSLKREYIIPRFQREYSWGQDELTVLLNDIIDNLKLNSEGFLETTDYFIGSLVLAGEDDKDTKFNIVDGQQRLTTITIFFSVLVEIFNSYRKTNLVEATQRYIEALNDDNEAYLVLVNENPKPFFQFRIQQLEKDDSYEPRTEEELSMMNAFIFFKSKLEKDILLKYVNKHYSLNLDSDDQYIDLLKIMRNQVLGFKSIYITVKKIDDAYLIFETLNAKGKDLEAIDLIKNQIFKVIKDESTGDLPKERWKEIRDILLSREEKLSFKQFYRYYWISKYSFTREAQLFEDFKKKIPASNESYKDFLKDLKLGAQDYLKISCPNSSDWTEMELKNIPDSLAAMNIFSVTQHRTILLSLFEGKRKGIIKQKYFLEIIKLLENFHFKFNAITSSRVSNIESKYSTFARKIREAKDSNDIIKIVEEIKMFFEANQPNYSTFKQNFMKLYYTKNNTSDKKLIQYILRKFEKYYQGTNELKPSNLSLEHIMSESTNEYRIGLIGNILPLDKELNSEIGDVGFIDKLEGYRKSNYRTVEKFIEQYGDNEVWSIEDIEARTMALSALAYNDIWKI